ncbi:MAG: response regulator [Spirochaetales bacterium]
MGRVVIVEDQLIIGQVLGGVVEAAGHTVACICHKPERALAEILANAPDLVILDIGLGGNQSGADVLRDARAKGYEGRAIFVSAYPEKTMKSELEGVTYSMYLIKPVSESRLKSALSSLL